MPVAETVALVVNVCERGGEGVTTGSVTVRVVREPDDSTAVIVVTLTSRDVVDVAVEVPPGKVEVGPTRSATAWMKTEDRNTAKSRIALGP